MVLVKTKISDDNLCTYSLTLNSAERLPDVKKLAEVCECFV